MKTTLANITKLPSELIEAIDIFLRGGKAVKKCDDAFDEVRSKEYGHVAAVWGVMEQLNIPELIAPKNTRFRRLL